jgi:tetratricopeptide (TPR) repeat protein
MRTRSKLVLIAPVLLAVFAWAQSPPAGQSSQEGKASDSHAAQNGEAQKPAAKKSPQPELAPASRSGPTVAPENELPIAKAPSKSNSGGLGVNCVGAVNTTDCLSNAAPPNIPVQSGTPVEPSTEEAGPRAGRKQPASSSGDASDDSGGGLLQNLPPPRSDDGVSSSRDTKDKFGGVPPGEDVNEMHPFDPHQAAKDIEVGEFYFKRGNYKAAISRFRSALQSKPNDALATYRLAAALEKDNQLAEATKYYSLYLDILPTGDYAADAREAIERLERAQQASAPAR